MQIKKLQNTKMCEISSGGKQNQASSLDDGLDSPEDVRFKYH